MRYPPGSGEVVCFPLPYTRGRFICVFLSDTGGVLSVKHFSIKPDTLETGGLVIHHRAGATVPRQLMHYLARKACARRLNSLLANISYMARLPNPAHPQGKFQTGINHLFYPAHSCLPFGADCRAMTSASRTASPGSATCSTRPICNASSAPIRLARNSISLARPEPTRRAYLCVQKTRLRLTPVPHICVFRSITLISAHRARSSPLQTHSRLPQL